MEDKNLMSAQQVMGKLKIKKILSKKVVIILCVLAAVAIGAAIAVPKILKSRLASAGVVTQKTAVAKVGSIKVSVSGSGTIYYKDTYSASSTVASKLKKLYFKEGDTVKKGDLIAELDDSDAVDSLSTSKSNYLQNTKTNNDTIGNVAKLTIKAPFTGQVSDIQVKLGDKVSKGAKLFTLTDSSKLKLAVPFNSVDAAKLQAGQTVDVYVTSFMQPVKGTITFISNQAVATAAGGQLTNVEVSIDNPGAILSGMKASVEAETTSGTVASTETGALEYVSQRVVTSDIDGTIKSITIKNGQKIDSGSVVAILENEDVIKSKELAELKNQNLQTDYENAQKKLDNYKIYSDIDGVISEQKVKVGDNIKSAEVIATITDTSGLYFDIPIDELDVAKIEVGQKAEISVDALEETSVKPLTGEVTKIAFKGTSSNGVATFPITVKLDAPNEKIKGSMNANAEILITNVENVLMVPVEAVSKQNNKSYVWVKSAQGSGTSTSKDKNPQTPVGQDTSAEESSSARGGQNRNSAGANRNAGNNSSAAGTNKAAGGNVSIGKLVNGSSSNSSKSAQTTQNYYAGAVRTEVQIGANNATYIEIKSGLKAGDIVVLPQIKTTSSTQSTQAQGMGGFGGMSAPAGGGQAPGGQAIGGQAGGGRQ
jgi:HlyD family secretion protein